MNFKPNAWTLLFGLATLAAIYFYSCQCQHTPEETVIAAPEEKPSRCQELPPPDYKIPDDKAGRWIDRYKAYAQTIKAGEKLVNPDVIYFTLPRCEMEEMIKDIGEDSYVKAHLAINDDGVIVLVLQDIPYQDGSADGGGGGGFFDFTQPCPTFCG